MSQFGSANKSIKERFRLALRKLRQFQARKMLLESLEGRQLMATGPQLIGVQPNEGSLIQNGTVLHVSPRELVFRFDSSVELDPASLTGFSMSRAGADGQFERAYVSSDLGSNNAVVVDFAAASAGLSSNGIEIQFTKVARQDSSTPTISVSGQRINVEVNVATGFKTSAQDLVDAFRGNAAASRLVLATHLRGNIFTPIADTVPTDSTLKLTGANAAKGSSNLGVANLQVEFIAQKAGPTGRNIQIVVNARDMGSSNNNRPEISVSGSVINVTLNRNSLRPSTAQEMIDAINSNTQSSALVLARAVSGSTSVRIGNSPITYSPITLAGGNDVTVTPAFIGLGDSRNEVIFRFAEELPDDIYLVDILGRGPLALKNIAGQPFNSGIDLGIQFELDLGAKIQAVVPQPIVRTVNPSTQQVTLTQQSRVIEVYFNDDDLYAAKTTSTSTLSVSTGTKLFQVADISQFEINERITLVAPSGVGVPRMTGTITSINSTTRQISVTINTVSGTGSFSSWEVFPSGSVLNPEFFQLRYTRDTIDSNDDVVFVPQRVDYSAATDRAILTFPRDLDNLTDGSGNVLPIKALRLRIGSDEEQLAAPAALAVGADPGSRFASALDISANFNPVAGSPRAIVLSSEIRNTTPYSLDFIGGNNAPGVRDNRYQRHVTTTDADGIQVIEYNFQGQLGNEKGSTQLNAITEEQKALARQALSLYEGYLGVRFVETAARGITIAVGDMEAVVNGEANRVGGLLLASGTLLSNGQPAVVLDIQDFNNATQATFGGDFFRTLMRGIGTSLGYGFADEIPQLTVQSNQTLPSNFTESVFPGAQDVINGQFILRPESKDIDLYRFSLPIAGELAIESIAERLASPSLLDTTIRLYQQQADNSFLEIAINDDYYSQDSLIRVKVSQGNYIVGISAKGNASYDPKVEDSGLGGRSEGAYELRIDFHPPQQSYMTDLNNDGNGSNVQIDGNGDGRPGGAFDFWFVPTGNSNMIVVDKAYNGSLSTGTLLNPFKEIDQALAAVTATKNVVRIIGNGGADGLLSTPADNLAYEVGRNRLGVIQTDGETFDVPKNVTVMVDAGAIIKLRQARISVGSSTVSVDRSGGAFQSLGVPRLINATGQVLNDLEGNAIPGSVYFTSLHDTIGRGNNTDRTPPAANPGDWGGIDFRNLIDGEDERRTDNERKGLFLNSVIHSNIRFGGGQVAVDGVSQVITPIHMLDSRPTIAFNTISRSSNAAMAATPNSFKESNFNDPVSQASSATGRFIADFERVGPAIYGNRVVDNSINGLFVKISTNGSLETMTVAGRFDDNDIVHVVTENLIISGSPGGMIQDSVSPPTTLVDLAAITGSLAAGDYNYKLVYVDAAGQESIASAATDTLTLAAAGGIRLTNLPPVRSDLGFVGRRLYRSAVGGVGPYSFVATLNASQTDFNDAGTVSGATLVEAPTRLRPRLNGSLMVDPLTIVKLQGSRIEAQTGAQLIAEGADGSNVIFTSLNDTRYGFGGTFDTANRKGTVNPTPGDWGGIYAGQTSTLSLDYARVAYAGGKTRIQGAFADFNAIEIHQATARIANSKIENNADGVSTVNDTRTGYGVNSEGAIFVRGAQPIIVNNVINNNLGAAVTIDVNSLDYQLVDDRGRMTGFVNKATASTGNQGPLIDGNRLDQNDYNGMRVRGGTLTTAGVWDDTDIVHIVRDEIIVSNLYVVGGLRLLSKGMESLVVKFSGTDAGLTATGFVNSGSNRILVGDNPNRIGGSISVEGLPGAPVILTSLFDNSAGAGFTSSGLAQVNTVPIEETNAGDTVLPTGPEVNNGLLIDNDVDVNTAGFFSFDVGVGGSSNFGGRGGITAQGDANFLINENVIFSFQNYIDVGSNGGAIALGNTTITTQPTLVSPDLVASEGTFQGANGVVNWRVETFLENGISRVNNRVILTSTAPLGDIRLINYLDEDIQGVSDDLLFTTGTPGQPDFRAFTLDGPERIGFSHGGYYSNTTNLLEGASYVGWAADRFNLLQTDIQTGGTNYTLPGNINTTNLVPFSDPELGTVFGLADVTTAFAWNVDTTATRSVITSFLELIPRNPSGTLRGNAGDWRGILIDTYSNDQNSQSALESESTQSNTQGSNEIPASSQYLGVLGSKASGGDENTRAGFLINGTIKRNSDLDVYSFVAKGGTEVWFDIDMTSSSLDTVVELIDANGEILALSDNSFNEEINASLLYQIPNTDLISQGTVNPLRKSSKSLVDLIESGANANQQPKDVNSTNPRDAGFRIVLPGLSTSQTLYHVRVRSSNLQPGDAASKLRDPAQLLAGRSQGAYQLSIRLSEKDLTPGSTISYADIRFASTAIDLAGVPRHSPLVGEAGEAPETFVTGTNTLDQSIATALDVGNIISSDRGTVSIAGSLSADNDVDWYRFNINYNLLTSNLARYLSTVFDVDYADGIGKADTSLYVFDSTGTLIAAGLDSNILDDRAAALKGADIGDLSRGSAGTLDAYIGAMELPAGTYTLAVTNKSQVPSALASALTRVQPIMSQQLIVEDHVQSDGGSGALAPQIVDFVSDANAAVRWTLSDMKLYSSQSAGNQLTNVLIVNPFTGEVVNKVSDFTVGRDGGIQSLLTRDLSDVAFRSNGQLYAFENDTITDGDGNLLNDFLIIDTGTGAQTDVGEDVGLGANFFIEALTIGATGRSATTETETGLLVAHRDGPGAVQYTQNILYEFDLDNGNIISKYNDRNNNNANTGSGSTRVELGQILTGNTAGVVSRRLVLPAATTVRIVDGAVNPTTTQRSRSLETVSNVRDGDRFVVQVGNLQRTFEFNSGPELFLNYNEFGTNSLASLEGRTFALDGITYEFDSNNAVTGTNTPVRIQNQMTYQQLAAAIQASMPATVTIGLEGRRMNFSGAIAGGFTSIPANIASGLNSDGNVSLNAISIPFLANDSQEIMANRVAKALSDNGVNATAAGRSATIAGNPFIVSTTAQRVGESLKVADVPPGGRIDGITLLNRVLYAVSNSGGLYRIDNPTRIDDNRLDVTSEFFADTYLESSSDLLGIEFTGLTRGPELIMGGVLRQILFGSDAQGRIWAFDTNGVLQPIFANGATFIASGQAGLTGITFPPQHPDRLWSVTNAPTTQQGVVPGNGIQATPDGIRPASTQREFSWYFGDTNPPNGQAPSYNLPGGVGGVLESKPFSLVGVSASDQPRLYFNYFLGTEDASASNFVNGQYMRDSFRVYAGDESGNWVMLTTNNSFRGPNLDDDEFDVANSGSTSTQETFDRPLANETNPSWRQASVSLGALAGRDNIRLRFEFNTAGGFGWGRAGGRGPELRVLAGNRLTDGQTMVVNGTLFEIEMGSSLVMPSGSAIPNNHTIVIEGRSFVFYDGTGAAPAGNVTVIPYTAQSTALEIAQALHQALLTARNSNLFPRQLITGVDVSPEDQIDNPLSTIPDNSIIRHATPSGLTGNRARMTGSGFIGDFTQDIARQASDVDLIRVDLEAGASLSVTATGSGELTPRLRLFDLDGNEFSFTSSIVGRTVEFTNLNIPKKGTYFVGVSSFNNTTYLPTIAGSSTGTGPTGAYTIEITVDPLFNPLLDGIRIQMQGAQQITLPVDSPLQRVGSNGSQGVPIFVNITDSANQVGQAVRQSIADYFSRGVTSTFELREEFLNLTGMTVQSAGPFGLTTTKTEDEFSEFAENSPLIRRAFGARNNNFTGVYLDDFMIGFAERGEVVISAPANTTGFVSSGNTSGILTGDYQVEIRTGEPYINVANRTFATSLERNERLVSGQNITFKPGAQIVDHSTFMISDGVNSFTFEFVNLEVANNQAATSNLAITYRSTDTASVIAGKVLSRINGSDVQSTLNVQAMMINGDWVPGTATSDTLAILGTASVVLGDPAQPNNNSLKPGTLETFTRTGDSNTPRDQGQVVVSNSRISHSSGFGIQSRPDNATTTNRSDSPRLNPGSVRNTVVRNNERLAPGAVLVNNEILFNQAGGINIVGDSNTTSVVSYVRAINNTVIGGTISAPASTGPLVLNGLYFPEGTLSFADAVITNGYRVGNPAPVAGLQDASRALGQPDYVGNLEPVAGQGAVSLGSGGSLTVRFVNNYLSASGDDAPDLYISEVGVPESFQVELSLDGITYRTLGTQTGGRRTIDIDAFGFRPSDRIQFVRITDVASQGAITGDSVGADIDAVGAITTWVAESYTAGGVGIQVGTNSSPTLLNNVVVNSLTGILVDASSNTTIVGGTLFQRNGTNFTAPASVSQGQATLVASNNALLYRDVARTNLYPAQNSLLIDSSIDSLPDRSTLVVVKTPLGLELSPVLAPVNDVYGQLRIDDPTVETPAGVGANVFKDRGASDRSDFVGPGLFISYPLDNDSTGEDINREVDVVERLDGALRSIDIQLNDSLVPSGVSQGSGIDDRTVTASSVMVFRNGAPLVPGVDYRFGYNATSGIVRLTPLAGVWESEATYTIRMLNTTESEISFVNPSTYADGSTFTIFDAAGNPFDFELDLGYQIQIPSNANGLHTLRDGDRIVIDDGSTRQTFEINLTGSVTLGNVAIEITADMDLLVEATEQIASTLRTSGLNIGVNNLGNGRLQITGGRALQLNASGSNLTVTGVAGSRSAYGLRIPLQAGIPNGLTDGQQFTIRLGNGDSQVFELDNNGFVSSGAIAINLVGATTAVTLGGRIVTAINQSGLGLNASYTGDGFIALGGDAFLNVSVGTGSALTVTGTPGSGDSVRIPISLRDVTDSDMITQLVANAIRSANIPGVTLTLFGSRILVEGANGVVGVNIAANPVPAVSDLAGNPIRANQFDGQTIATVQIGSGFDYGDADPALYTTLNVNGGAKHKVVQGFSLGNAVSVDGDARVVDSDSFDDGVQFATSIYAGFNTDIVVTATGISGSQPGFLSAWMDFDGDGTFETFERLAAGQVLVNGANSITIRVPSTAKVGEVYARFRLSSSPIASSTGEAADGEVEDYKLTILANPYVNPSNALDVSNDSKVSPIDALQVLNFLNEFGSQPLTTPVNRPVPPFLDVNGNGRVESRDALIVINFLNGFTEGEGEGEGEGSSWISADAPEIPSSVPTSSDSVEGPTLAQYLNSQRRNSSKPSVGPVASASVLDDPAVLGLEDILGDLASDSNASSDADSLFNVPFWE